MRFVFAENLTVRLEGLPMALETRVSSHLRYFASPRDEPEGGAEVTITLSPPPEPTGASRTILEQDDLRVLEDSGVVVFELAGLAGWVRPAEGRAGFWIATPGSAAVDAFLSVVLPPMIVELARAAGLLGLHAAAVALAGKGLLLPGPSGCGKSTLYRYCRRSGFAGLSDDLVWLSSDTSSDETFRLHPFPRGWPEDGTPWPTTSRATLEAVVFPTIADRPGSRLSPVDPGEALDALLAETGFLALAPGAESRFGLLARLVGARPAFRLEVGRGADASELLRALIASGRPRRGCGPARPS